MSILLDSPQQTRVVPIASRLEIPLRTRECFTSVQNCCETHESAIFTCDLQVDCCVLQRSDIWPGRNGGKPFSVRTAETVVEREGNGTVSHGRPVTQHQIKVSAPAQMASSEVPAGAA